MNRTLGGIASVVNFVSVATFGVALLFNVLFLCYASSSFIALSFVVMMAAFCASCEKSRRAAGFCAVAFGAVYTALILLVYFAQLTTVRLEPLTEQAATLIGFQNFSLFFYYDLLGYALMALATFFAGLTVRRTSRCNKWLNVLLLVHGVFFLSCFFMPILGVFSPGTSGDAWMGTVALLVWCAYFLPISALSICYFSKTK